MEHERRVVVDLDQGGQLLLLPLHVDERVAVVVEDPEEAVDADVDARRLEEQLEHFSHTDFTIAPYELYVSLAERLTKLAPISGEKKAAFFNAGTEAVENAIKFARSYTKRPAVIAFEGAFHGRTLLSMSLTSKTHPYKAGLGPFSPEVYRVPFAQAYRGPSAAEALRALERALVTTVAAETVAAIVIELVPGEGGVVVAPREIMAGVRRICDEIGIVFVAEMVH